MSAWQELVKQALIGNISNNKISPLVLQQLTDYQLIVKGIEPEKILLKAAALNSKLYAAAQIPKKQTPNTNIANPETQAYCSKQQEQQLQYILLHNHDEILLEFLDLLAEQNSIVPPVFLPDLLQYGASNPALQSRILNSIGHRGTWLAQFVPNWNYATTTSLKNQAEEVFFYGILSERISYIKQLHQKNPLKAIDLLEEVWASESYANRADFIKAIGDSLVADDEPFLEKALSDTRKEVREPAANLLATLANSSLVQRMQQLIQTLISYDAQQDLFLVELPNSCTDTMKRDGIQARKEPLKGQGPKANQLAQIISKIAPQWWVDTFDKSPEQLLSLAAKTEWKNIFVWAWAMAAKNFGAKDWIIACHRFYLNTFLKSNWSNFPIDFLYENLSNDLFNLLAADYLKTDVRPTLSDDHPIVNFLLAEGQKWNDAISLTVIQRIQKTILKDSYVFQWSLKAILKRAAFSISPHLYDQISEGWPIDSTAWLYWQKEVNSLLDILKFRLQLLENK